MFIANFDGAPCWTGPNPAADPGESNQGILNFPDPGNLGTVLEQPHFSVFNGPGYNCPKNSNVPAFNGAARSPTTAGAPSVSTSAASSPSPSTATTSPSGVFQTISPTGTTTIIPSLTYTPQTPSLTTIKTSPTSYSTSKPSPATSINPTTATPSSSPTAAVPPLAGSTCPFPNSFPCTKPDGVLACRDTSALGLCTNGCAQAVPVAAGMQCVKSAGTMPDVYQRAAT